MRCCVPGCISHSEKDKIYTAVLDALINRLKRENMNPVDNSYVCSDPYTEDCSETNLVEKSENMVKKGAIPSVFSFG